MNAYKQCSCGCEYSRSEWYRLEHVATQAFDPSDPSEPAYEYRNCAVCDSTLVIEHPRRDARRLLIGPTSSGLYALWAVESEESGVEITKLRTLAEASLVRAAIALPLEAA